MVYISAMLLFGHSVEGVKNKHFHYIITYSTDFDFSGGGVSLKLKCGGKLKQRRPWQHFKGKMASFY